VLLRRFCSLLIPNFISLFISGQVTNYSDLDQKLFYTN